MARCLGCDHLRRGPTAWTMVPNGTVYFRTNRLSRPLAKNSSFQTHGWASAAAADRPKKYKMRQFRALSLLANWRSLNLLICTKRVTAGLVQPSCIAVPVVTLGGIVQSSRTSSRDSQVATEAAMSRSFALLISLTFVACLGCSQPTTSPPQQTASQDTIDQVCRIAAELLGVDVAKIHPSTSLGDLGADELDTIELIMELEDHFDVTIPDGSVSEVTGDDEWQTGIDRLTMERLAEIVDRQKG